MAVPKRKTSKARRDKRKSANMKMKAPGLSICPQCHEPKLPHRVCPNCTITTAGMLWNPLKRKERVTDCYRKNEAVSRSDTAFCARGGE